ncbi:hypothetical protein J2I47_00415 [Fibrella sp. HMF5335]|uniref:Uncharacterized protein n=1 Tax=Fibrella rubiginis TaxID=2817060 RepID=A0A939GEC2_9BACT|nr:hypothetical protein [Fibrella rubiginis]MBO0934997.1 hypothetical protein [Fibrella rubiginis]
MATNLHWVKQAFDREIHITENGVEVGRLHRAVFDRDVDAALHKTQLRFDVTGFLINTVNIHDLAADNRIVGTITFHFGKRAELTLENGNIYTWKRQNILMRQWIMIREGVTDADDKEVVNYSLTRQFFVQEGDMQADLDSPEADIVMLAGLFIRQYFQRRRRIAAGGAVAAFGV